MCVCGETPACAHLSAPVPLPQVGPAIPGSAVNMPGDGRRAEDAHGACPEPLLARSLTSVEGFVPDLLYVMVNFKWAPYVLFAASGKFSGLRVVTQPTVGLNRFTSSFTVKAIFGNFRQKLSPHITTV